MPRRDALYPESSLLEIAQDVRQRIIGLDGTRSTDRDTITTFFCPSSKQLKNVPRFCEVAHLLPTVQKNARTLVDVTTGLYYKETRCLGSERKIWTHKRGYP